MSNNGNPLYAEQLAQERLAGTRQSILNELEERYNRVMTPSIGARGDWSNPAEERQFLEARAETRGFRFAWQGSKWTLISLPEGYWDEEE